MNRCDCLNCRAGYPQLCLKAVKATPRNRPQDALGSPRTQKVDIQRPHKTPRGPATKALR